jgi:hypothetical protein
MKKLAMLLAVSSTIFSGFAVANTVSYCPEPTDVNEIVLASHQHKLEGSTPYQGASIGYANDDYRDGYFDYDIPIAYFRDVSFEKYDRDPKMWRVSCHYVQQNGNLTTLHPLYITTPGFPSEEYISSGDAGGPWSGPNPLNPRQCNSPDPANCFFAVLKQQHNSTAAQ